MQKEEIVVGPTNNFWKDKILWNISLCLCIFADVSNGRRALLLEGNRPRKLKALQLRSQRHRMESYTRRFFSNTATSHMT